MEIFSPSRFIEDVEKTCKAIVIIPSMSNTITNFTLIPQQTTQISQTSHRTRHTQHPQPAQYYQPSLQISAQEHSMAPHPPPRLRTLLPFQLASTHRSHPYRHKRQTPRPKQQTRRAINILEQTLGWRTKTRSASVRLRFRHRKGPHENLGVHGRATTLRRHDQRGGYAGLHYYAPEWVP